METDLCFYSPEELSTHRPQTIGSLISDLDNMEEREPKVIRVMMFEGISLRHEYDPFSNTMRQTWYVR